MYYCLHETGYRRKMVATHYILHNSPYPICVSKCSFKGNNLMRWTLSLEEILLLVVAYVFSTNDSSRFIFRGPWCLWMEYTVIYLATERDGPKGRPNARHLFFFHRMTLRSVYTVLFSHLPADARAEMGT